jgi:hypothetical protein
LSLAHLRCTTSSLQYSEKQAEHLAFSPK